jgi:hypothetical protein
MRMIFFHVYFGAVHFWENFPKKQWGKIGKKSLNTEDPLRTHFVRITAAERDGDQRYVVASRKSTVTPSGPTSTSSFSVVVCGLCLFGKIFPKRQRGKIG